MGAAYDDYDYEEYWSNREYEHHSEQIALSRLLEKISEIKRVVDFGCGYGRLIENYSFRAEQVYLIDPSAKVLSRLKKQFKLNRKYKVIRSTIQRVSKKIGPKSFDLAIMVRVLHHIKNVDKVFEVVSRSVKPGGYFILEYPNKRHGKEIFKKLLKGNILYPADTTSIDRCKQKKAIPFQNFHPFYIERKLDEYGFDVLQSLSVSNLRGESVKKMLPLETMLQLERILQGLLGGLKFGPSVFVLARKRG